MDSLISTVQDVNLRLTLSFGIGLHHAGLQQRDRSLVEELFVNQKIQVRILYSLLCFATTCVFFNFFGIFFLTCPSNEYSCRVMGHTSYGSLHGVERFGANDRECCVNEPGDNESPSTWKVTESPSVRSCDS